MSPFDYKYLRGLLKERSGLVLGDDKEYLVEARLMPVELLQALFALDDPEAVAEKFRRFATLDPASEAARLFVAQGGAGDRPEPLSQCRL